MVQSSIMYCARHPKTETSLTCASCGTPICVKCMVVTPVGMKCRACGTNKGGALFTVRPERFALAGLTALAAGVVAGVIGAVAGFFIFFVAFAYGYFAGSVVLKASGMKRGWKIEFLTGLGMVAGALGFKLLTANLNPFALLCPSFWITVAISTACAVSKIRYL
ncbi:MAG: B-box zinc finger protein [Armatimonadota bacterium]